MSGIPLRCRNPRTLTPIGIMKPNRIKRAERGMLTCPFVNRHPKAGFAAALNVLKIPFRVFSS